MIQEELNRLIDEHEKWLKDRSQGKKLELRNVNLKGFDISKRRLINAILENIDLSESSCEETTFYGDDTLLKNIKFCKANLKKAVFTDCNLEYVDFTGANLEEAELMGFVIAKNITFDNAQMDKASFIKSSMDFVSFKNASLVNADFFRTYCHEGNFENADLRGVRFSYATIYDCKVKGAIIEDADFSDARDLPEEWKREIGWYSEEQENVRRIKQHLRENPVR